VSCTARVVRLISSKLNREIKIDYFSFIIHRVSGRPQVEMEVEEKMDGEIEVEVEVEEEVDG